MFLIYSPHITNRLLYVLDYVFKEQLDIDYLLTTDKNECLQTNGVKKIIYADENIGDGIFIHAHSLLFETRIKQIELAEGKINDQFVLFKHDANDDFGFDVFAGIFFLLSRYEEYYDLPKDKFDNYNFGNSILFRQTVLDVPVVEQWMNVLKKKFQERYLSIQFKKESPSYLLTFDVDVAFAYRNRSLKRIIGGFGKKLLKFRFKEFADQLLTVLHLRKDMFDTFSYISSSTKNKKSIYFFNMGKYDLWDKNPSYQNKKFQKLIQHIHEKNSVGLHPSYASNSNEQLVSVEKKCLETIIHAAIIKSRQHHLKLQIPKTYTALLNNKIAEDYTIGYHDTYGFRAGTCKSFLFFDVEKNETTPLRLFPFCIMEGTLNDVLHLDIGDAKKTILKLISVVCEYGGIFIPVWHNSTLSDKDGWKNWREVFEYMLTEIDNHNMKNFLD